MLAVILPEQNLKSMISEILEFFSFISQPIKKDNPSESGTNFLVFVSYVVSAVCGIFIISELKEAFNQENPLRNIILNIFVSCLLTFLMLLVLRKLNLLNNLVFSKFIGVTISIYLVFTLVIFILKDYVFL